MLDEQQKICGLTWWIPLAISLLGLFVALASNFEHTFLFIEVMACAIGFPMARRCYALLVVVVSIAIVLPSWLALAPPNEAFIQMLALLIVALLAALRLTVAEDRIADFESSPTRYLFTSDPNELVEDAPTQIISKTASPKSEGDFSIDVEPLDRVNVDNGLQAVLKRFQTKGKFSTEQMRIIEQELQRDHGELGEFAGRQTLKVGEQLGRVVIDGKLGHGGEANVYRAHDVDTGERAAVKILKNARVSQRFQREMHMIHQVAHRNIVTAYDVGQFRGLPFIAMELLDGPDLNCKINESGPLEWATATRYVLQVCRGLAHAHERGVLHRDVKPANIICNGNETVKLADLGLASICHERMTESRSWQYETQDGHLAGTLPFMAPEQARSLLKATSRSDIYALGATWFYLLTGRSRLRGRSFSQQLKNLLVRARFSELPEDSLPPMLRNVYQQMVAYHARERFDSCAELATELELAIELSGETYGTDHVHVLVIAADDDPLAALSNALGESNRSLQIHRSDRVENGFQIVQNEAPDIVLWDATSMLTPESIDVRDALGKFRETPVVLVTCTDAIGNVALEAGANAFVPKKLLSAHRLERTIFTTLSRCRTGLAKAEGSSLTVGIMRRLFFRSPRHTF